MNIRTYEAKMRIDKEEYIMYGVKGSTIDFKRYCEGRIVDQLVREILDDNNDDFGFTMEEKQIHYRPRIEVKGEIPVIIDIKKYERLCKEVRKLGIVILEEGGTKILLDSLL